MIKNVYEILDEFSSVTTRSDRKKVLMKYNYLLYFKEVLMYTFNPKYDFHVKEFPKDYIKPDTAPGIRFAGLESEMRRVYLFIKGNQVSDNLTEQKRNILLLQLIESFEPREAEVFINMMKKDLKVKGLTKSIVEEVYPELLS